jgi:DNA-directed RNA polymerase subunit beta
MRGNEGLNTFMENFQLQIQEIFVLEFLDYFVDPPRYTIQECIERGLTHSVPKSKVKSYIYCTDPSTKILKLLFKMYILGQSRT